MIDAKWSTEKLEVRDARKEDLPALEQVLQSNGNTLLLDGIDTCDPAQLHGWLAEGDLPPGGSRERYRLQSILRKDADDVIGYISLYHGYPEPETLYIASMLIRKDHQRQGYGTEIVSQLAVMESLQPYRKHRLVVSVSNWGAVRFWVRHGFTNIVRVQGDSGGQPKSVARLELVRHVS